MSTEDALFSDWGNLPARPGPGGVGSDGELDRVVQWFFAQPDLKNRFSGVMRQSIDEVLDGQRTGRYDLDELEKTEKTYLGTKVEIVCRAEFGLGRGSKMDYRISDTDVDAKFSLTGQWMIPREAMGHLCLVMSANDKDSEFRVGLVRIREDILTAGGNQDGKRSISKFGRSSIYWLCESGRLRGNLLLGLDPDIRARIMATPAGQGRVDELFRCVQGRVVDRNSVVTTGRQLDAPKRVRDSRKRLAPEGIIILGHQNDSPMIAASLGLPIPSKGEWVAARIVPASPGAGQVVIAAQEYRLAEPGDPVAPAPPIHY